ncbi:MAG TPA: protein kinase, partial [Agitococcus sp.]|nr:protein kinase [Agitococcus sp.]
MMIQSIGKYHIDGIIGHGAMGIVYKGFDSSINRTVAIKTIHHHLLLGDSGTELLKRFKMEATAAARCQHQNIIAIYDFGQQEDNSPYIVMEFV